MKTRPILTLFAALSTTLPSLAYAEHLDDTEQLEKITVSTPSTTPTLEDYNHLTEQQILEKRAQTSDTASLLKGLPGVSLYGAGGVSSLPSIHGLADDRLRIKVDGMDLISACANHMNPPLSYISPTNVADVKVYPGISPVSVGGDSIGGTIEVDSKAPEFASDDKILKKGEVGTYYRSNGNAWGTNLSATLATQNFSVNYDGSYATSHNYTAAKDFKTAGPAASDRGHIAADEVGSTAYETRNHELGFGLKLSDTQLLQLKLGLQHIPYQGWPNQRMDMVDNTSRQINLIYDSSYDWGTLHASVYNEHTNHKMQFGNDKQFLYGTAEGMPMETEGHNTGVSVKTEINLSQRDLLRVGGDIQRYRLDDYWNASGGKMMAPDTFWNINNGKRDRYAVFGEWQATWSQRWLTLAGVRQELVKMDTGNVQGYNAMYSADANKFNSEDHSKTDNNTDLTLLTKFTPSENATYEWGYAQKTRSPNLYERYAWSTNGMAMRMVNLAGDGNGYVGNLDLKPEVAHTLSITADWHDKTKKQWGLAVTPYYTYVNNFIDAYRIANLTTTDNFVYLKYDNVDAELYGFDVSAHKLLYQGAQIGNFESQAVISYVHGKNQDTGDNLYNIMPLNATFTLAHSKGRWHSQVEWELVAAKDKVNATRNEIKTGGYGLLNLRTSYDWGRARVDLGIENALNKFYSQPLAGAYLGQGMTMSGTAVPWGVTVPGMGRSLYAGLTVKF